ncbi:hypothetical protein PF005_g17104 [Phytophthora fragariae]|uniref:Uncharacterized protein n=1 Tax=Phytophthora fragariae TaxID=53985 RepID=A0A6A3FYN9_9STRA|nr:hypothetical protein PF003_g27955 [Phytophthora fragariae]KAE8949330.1 hypothetical protein PF009_g1146 [Phytophthora fragariae]KAE8995601.1 hypothetical protein PF011_g16261 [Phytophthora fragariae]KAE9138452.1 hypothetical protein PF010_g945 [Phytophthora fragariae]KAE9139554.1 hypothetical protein PF007_g995 [Phytophthora fragariae]
MSPLMMRHEDSTDPCPAFTPRKRLKQAHLPLKIQRQPKVLTLIEQFAMSPEEAAQEAAATNQVQWLQNLLSSPQFHAKMNGTAQKLTEIAATHGHSDAIVAVYKWWDCLDSRQKRRVGCGRAHFLALENGHFEAFVGLQALYNKMDMSEGLNAALENGHQRVVDTICKNLPYSKSLAWAAQFGRLEVIRIVMGQEGFDTHR